MAEIEKTSEICSVERSIEIIGGKWKLYLIRVFLVEGPSRFNELLNAVEGISPKVLTENLRSLEQAGVVTRIEENNVQTYALTASGEGLEAALHAMGTWADKHEKLIQTSSST